jgi:phosphate starvation-inducible membrane PsiE
MQHKLSNNLQPLLFKALLWLGGVALLFLIKDVVEIFSDEPVAGTWVDLTLVLTAYLMFFLLHPISSRIDRRLRKRARRNLQTDL